MNLLLKFVTRLQIACDMCALFAAAKLQLLRQAIVRQQMRGK